MKRLFALVFALMLIVSTAVAETADSLHKLFVRQLTGGNGFRGYISLTASGVAEWLNYLMPFTASDIQIRGIGEKQGDLSADILDDDEWQVRFYTKNADGREVGTTWLYGDPDGIYFDSELLPGTKLRFPTKGLHLMYQLFQGAFDDLFFAYDPLSLMERSENGTVAAYDAIADMMGISAKEWEDEWFPVLEEYFLHLDLWLNSYGDPAFLTGETGALKMSATYKIPVDDLKREAKYIIGQMLFDNELQNLLAPLVSTEQRITYLNPTMVYFYEACIDALPLEGEITLAREMSASGEITSTMISLPIPQLPSKVVEAVSQTAKEIFGLPYDDMLANIKQLIYVTNGNHKSITLNGTKRNITIDANAACDESGLNELAGTIRITPEIGVDENAFLASFNCTYGNRNWQDENYLSHEQTSFAISFDPHLEALSADDPFRGAYVDFSPVSLALVLEYRNNTFQQGSPAQLNFSATSQVRDAQFQLEGVLRITTQLQFSALETEPVVDIDSLSVDDKRRLLDQFHENAVHMMANLNAEIESSQAQAEEE